MREHSFDSVNAGRPGRQQPAFWSFILPGPGSVMPQFLPIWRHGDVLVGYDQEYLTVSQQLQACPPLGFRVAEHPPGRDEHVRLSTEACPLAEAHDPLAWKVR